MKKYFRKASFLILVFIMAIFQACKNEPPTDLTRENIIPKPVSVVATGTGFRLISTSVIFVEGGNADLMKIGNQLAAELKAVTGFAHRVEPAAHGCAGRVALPEFTDAGHAGQISRACAGDGRLPGDHGALE